MTALIGLQSRHVKCQYLECECISIMENKFENKESKKKHTHNEMNEIFGLEFRSANRRVLCAFHVIILLYVFAPSLYFLFALVNASVSVSVIVKSWFIRKNCVHKVPWLQWKRHRRFTMLGIYALNERISLSTIHTIRDK